METTTAPRPATLSEQGLQSEVINFLRFPLIVGVIFIHSLLQASFADESVGVAQSSLDVANIVRYLFSEVLCRLAVPTFFLISGYLFFYRIANWNSAVYISKLRRRVDSLLLPYLFWNGVVLLAFYLIQGLLPQLWSGTTLPIRDYTILDLLRQFWDGTQGMPINYAFWFIRNLLVLVLLSPLVWGVVRYLKLVGLVVLGALCLFKIHLLGINPRPVFFFTVGAYLSIHQIDMVQFFGRWRLWPVALYALLALLNLVLMRSPAVSYIHFVSLLVGIVALFNLVSMGLTAGKLHINNYLMAAAFFVFAAHAPLIGFLHRGLFYLLHPTSQWALLSCYFGQVVLVIGLLLAVYTLLRRCCPRLLAWITGGR